MDERYIAMAQPPQDALKKIGVGNLKGKSDINPQWRIEALTTQFGLCGFGWKYEIVEKHIETCPEGQVLLYMQVNLFVKVNDEWSAPIPGFGGDMIVQKNKNGLVPNDEAFKMCLTDALGNAAKCIGVAANIYRGFCDSKYGRREEEAAQSQQPASQPEPKMYGTHVRYIGAQCQILSSNGNWYNVEQVPTAQLQKLLTDNVFEAAHDAIEAVLSARSVKQ